MLDLMLVMSLLAAAELSGVVAIVLTTWMAGMTSTFYEGDRWLCLFEMVMLYPYALALVIYLVIMPLTGPNP